MIRSIFEGFGANRSTNAILRDSSSDAHWDLRPLTPEYIEYEHEGYVKAITAALHDDQIWNIALSGNYGVGKSSILREVARRHEGRVVELSLSTLAPMEASQIDDSVPKQATTPTNRIQQEIVKQLLYREEPEKTPGSRFRRIGRFNWWRELAKATLLSLPVAVVFLLTGWSGQIGNVFAPFLDVGVYIHPLVWAVAASSMFLARHLFHGQLRITQFSAGSATVTLDDKSVSYFDQYLDEIVYFFDVSERDVVIFEDIDRFNDSHIFETLRSLNTLLNASPQIDKPIHFIYAIRDSIFDQIGLQEAGRKLEHDTASIEDPAKSETIRANRTKFFDLVIPVVPFITHRSARNLAVQLLDEIDHNVAPELLDLAAKYVPDMRLLKNVRNEFVVFRDRIFSGNDNQLKLSETNLFAMMLYKSTHLTDFEAIRLRLSRLDSLYDISRELVRQNIGRLERKVRTTRKHLDQLDGAETRSKRLGQRLLSHVQRTAQAARFQTQNATYTFASKRLTEDDLQGSQFWREFASAGEKAHLQWRNNYGQSLLFTSEHLAAELSDPMEPTNWDESEREVLDEKLREQNDDLKFLRGADLGELIERPKFLVEHHDTEQYFDEIARGFLSDGLAYQLVRAGYINRNFTLYTSTFHGDRVGPVATNFIIHHVERDLMDEHFELAAEDVDAVVRERGRNALSDPALYNIDILDRLLQTDPEAADVMVRSLAGFGERQTRFMQAYISGGTQQTRFIERFTPISSRLLFYLVNQAELDDALRLKLINVSLAHLSEWRRYQANGEVSAYLANYYAAFETLTSQKLSPSQAERISDLFCQANVKISLLKPLSETVRRSFVQRNLYEIGHENIAVAIGNKKSLALDTIRSVDQTVYKYVLANLGKYIESIDGVSSTVEGPEDFVPVIEDVLAREPDRLGDVIERASRDCLVADIASVPEAAWPLLAADKRFRATFSNVRHYINNLGTLDANLVEVLVSTGAIEKTSKADNEAKTGLAKAILSADSDLLPAKLRADLVVSLGLSHHLELSDIVAQTGELFSLLLKHDLISDDATTYGHLANTDWSTREAFIRESREFKGYVSPDLVATDLESLLRSDKIDRAVKVVIAERARDYIERGGSGGLRQLARFARQEGLLLEQPVVQKMALGSVPASDVIVLLKPHLAHLGREELFATLEPLDGDYSKLTAVGWEKVKIPQTAADRALLEKLKLHGIVNSYSEKGATFKVNKKRK